MPNAMYSPSHRQAGAPAINTQSTFRTAPDLCKKCFTAIHIGNNGNSYTVSTQSRMCVCVCVYNIYIYIYIYNYYSLYRDAGRAK